MALCGMILTCDDSGDCTIVRPPWRFTLSNPSAPSSLAPLNKIAMQCLPKTSAAELKSTSIAGRL